MLCRTKGQCPHSATMFILRSPLPFALSINLPLSFLFLNPAHRLGLPFICVYKYPVSATAWPSWHLATGSRNVYRVSPGRSDLKSVDRRSGDLVLFRRLNIFVRLALTPRNDVSLCAHSPPRHHRAWHLLCIRCQDKQQIKILIKKSRTLASKRVLRRTRRGGGTG